MHAPAIASPGDDHPRESTIEQRATTRRPCAEHEAGQRIREPRQQRIRDAFDRVDPEHGAQRIAGRARPALDELADAVAQHGHRREAEHRERHCPAGAPQRIEHEHREPDEAEEVEPEALLRREPQQRVGHEQNRDLAHEAAGVRRAPTAELQAIADPAGREEHDRRAAPREHQRGDERIREGRLAEPLVARVIGDHQHARDPAQQIELVPPCARGGLAHAQFGVRAHRQADDSARRAAPPPPRGYASRRSDAAMATQRWSPSFGVPCETSRRCIDDSSPWSRSARCSHAVAPVAATPAPKPATRSRPPPRPATPRRAGRCRATARARAR